jgi:hypothetical protein
MAKWEYKELRFEVKQRTFKKPHALIQGDYMQQLNDEGKKGWELVNTAHFNTNGFTQEFTMFLKRDISDKDKSFF